jgi:hypothetical protein
LLLCAALTIRGENQTEKKANFSFFFGCYFQPKFKLTNNNTFLETKHFRERKWRKHKMLNRKNKRLFAASILLSTFAVFACVAFDYPIAQASGGNDCETKQCRQDLARARAATAKYHNFDQAVADGFVQVSPCVEVPGLGGMGYHYLNFARFDTNVDPSEPELLLYMPNKNGKMQLVAVEYAAVYTGSNPAPVLFGQTMEGPVSHGGPLQYELHAWIWKNNPEGMFEPFNPSISCP